MNTAFQLICVYLLFFLHYGCVDVNGCKILYPKIGTVTRDHDVEVGSPIELNCSLYHHNISLSGKTYYGNSSQLYFKFSSSVLKDVHIINPLTSQLRLENSTVNNTGLYYCYLKIPSMDDVLVCTTKVSVGYQPLPVENFNCTSWHYRNLTCEWDLPFNPIHTDYVLYDYIVYVQEKNSYIGNRSCPVATPTSCQWRVDTDPMYRKQSKTLYFLLKANNSLNESNQVFKFDHYEIILPDKPHYLFLNETRKNSIHIRWGKPEELEFEDQPLLLYEIHYRSDVNSSDWEVTTVENKLEYQLTGLVPYTVYKVKIRCKSVSAKYRWSPFITNSCKTLPDIPYRVPSVVNEAVEVENFQVNRSITIHWKPVPKLEWNGRDFSYIVSYVTTHISRQKRESNFVKIPGDALFATINNLDQNSAYRFHIYTRNNEGTANVSTSVIVPRSYEMQSITPEDIAVLDYGEGKYKISWSPKNNEGLLNFTIFWCSSYSSPPLRKCSEPLDWKTFPIEKVKGEYEVELTLDNKNSYYLFAIAASTKDFSSGMKWASCMAIHNKGLGKIQKFEVKSENSTSLQATWTLGCIAQKKLIKFYQLTYCRVSGFCNGRCSCKCVDEETHVNISDSQSTTYVLNGLIPFTKYSVTIHASTHKGENENSDPWCAQTLSTAPSDPPQNAKVVSVSNRTITVSWEPPIYPNGYITSYIIYYNQYIQEEKAKMSQKKYEVTLRENVYSFTEYAIEIEACVKRQCSPHTEPIFALTDIGVPGRMDQPSLEVRNTTYVRISWKPPQMPNGPVNYYIITAQSSTPGGELYIFNVSGSENYTFAGLPCPTKEQGVMYNFKIQAANENGSDTLLGPLSEPGSTKLCYILDAGMQLHLMIGIIAGGTLGLMTLVVVLYLLVRWMKRKMDMIKDIKVLLPTGLESENPMQSYENFKQGLVQKGSDSSVSPRPYGRLNSYNSDEGDSKDRHDSGSSQYSNMSTEKLLHKRSSEFGRNPSGDSNTFSRGHDSISSSATNHTQLSSDSGTEMDLHAPPSPDTVFPESVSISTTPKVFTRSGLSVVEEGHDSDSKDSGLEKEGTTGMSPSSTNLGIEGHYTRFAGYLNNNNNRPYTNAELETSPVHQPPYSKFSINSPDSSCLPVAGQGSPLGALARSLANSEPSVVDFDGGNESEPGSVQGVSQYSRYGLARSVEGGLDRSTFPSTGYSKFGVIYHNFNTPNRSGIEPPASSYAGFGIQGSKLEEKKPYVTTNFAAVLLDKNKSQNQIVQKPDSSLGLALNSNKNLKTNSPVESKAALQHPKNLLAPATEKPAATHNDTYLSNPMLNGYSKFGIQPESYKPPVKSYIGFQQAKDLSDNTLVQSDNSKELNDNILPAVGYSKVDLHPYTANSRDNMHYSDEEVAVSPLLSRTSETESTGAKPKNSMLKAHNGYVPHTQMDFSQLPRPSSCPSDTKRNKNHVPGDVPSDSLPMKMLQNTCLTPVSNKNLKPENPAPVEVNGTVIHELPSLNTVPVTCNDTDVNSTPSKEETKLNAPPRLEPPTFPTDNSKPKVSLIGNSSKNYPSMVKAKSNGYVPMSDILGTDVPCESCKVEILPKGLQNSFSLSESDI